MDNKSKTIDKFRKFFTKWQSSCFRWKFREMNEHFRKHGSMPRLLVERWGSVFTAEDHIPTLEEHKGGFRVYEGRLSFFVVTLDCHGFPLQFRLDDTGVCVDKPEGDRRKMVCFWKDGDDFDKKTPARIIEQIKEFGHNADDIADGFLLFLEAYEKFTKDYIEAFDKVKRDESNERYERVRGVLENIKENGQLIRNFVCDLYSFMEHHSEQELEELAGRGIFFARRFFDLLVTTKLDRRYYMWPESYFRLDASYSGRIVLHQYKAHSDGEHHHFTVFDLRLADIELDLNKAAKEASKMMEHAQFNFEDCFEALDHLVGELLSLIREWKWEDV